MYNILNRLYQKHICKDKSKYTLVYKVRTLFFFFYQEP